MIGGDVHVEAGDEAAIAGTAPVALLHRLLESDRVSPVAELDTAVRTDDEPVAADGQTRDGGTRKVTGRT